MGKGFQRDKHLIRLEVWPSVRDSKTSLKTVSDQGYHLYHWTAAGMNYWVASDLNSKDLQRFVQLAKD